MRNISFLFLFISIFAFPQNQNQGRFWYFGENAGLDFITSPPSALNNGQINSVEGCSTISDDYGNLLFYTDGVTIFNASHSVMLNGSNLNGSLTGAQHLIVQNQQLRNLFYVFTTPFAGGYYYSIVDINLDSGKGAVISNRKNILLNSSVHEKITTYVDSSTSLNWIIVFGNGAYYAYRLVNGALETNSPVISVVPASDILIDIRGILKLSPDGSKLINTSVNTADTAVLTDFDKNTGIVTNPILLTSGTNFNSFYGAEFSPDSKLVYLNGNTLRLLQNCLPNGNQREIFQYNIFGTTGWNSTPIGLGGSTGINSTRGALQLGPDGKIYFARACQPFLGVISNPTVVGLGANYIDDAIPLTPGTTSREGLPNIALQPYSLTFNEIQGNVKLDSDMNGCTSMDLNFSNILLTFNTTSFNFSTFTRNDGNFIKRIPNGQFTVLPRPENPTYWNFSPPSFTVNFPTQTSPQTEDFCFTANGSIEDLEVIVVPLELARPGFDTDYKVVVKNKGNATTNGVVTLEFENSFMNLQSSAPAATLPATNQLSWSVSNLQPLQIEEFLFSMTLNTTTQTANPLNSGDVLAFTGIVTGIGTDNMPADNVMILNQTVVNSYDPNDKMCLEGKNIEPSMVGEFVHYMIRFENTGTASAINLVVKDVIDTAKFDIATLVPLGGSHNYYTTIREGNIVEFIHENINLDFNDATNDGYVLFKIKTLNTLVVGDTFDNTAEIFFDFNFPIITNTETVTVMSTASIDTATDLSINFYPNPVREFVNISAATILESVSVMDINGRLLSQTAFTGNRTSQQLNIENLKTGIYFLIIRSDKGQKTEKIIVE